MADQQSRSSEISLQVIESSTEEECLRKDKEYISTAWTSPGSTIPLDVLQFDHSFGYNCNRFFNLCLIDPEVLVFASGNLIHFFNVKTREMTFRRSCNGGGIGFITKNPNPDYNYLTVAENGEKPIIFIYKYPEMEVISILRKGADRSFSNLDYTPDGELLASQAGDPDYMLTIWNWKTNSVLLRAKSFQNDVIKVKFSAYDANQLSSSGLGHIKFWKMSQTFTGLKLKGELGRFGKTEICDIYAVYPMPDDKVISGTNWGNILVWDAGLIKFEVCRKNRKPCHTAPITQITMDDDEVMTVGMDGYIRIWFWETVELADPPDDDRFVEIEPIYEFKVGPKGVQCEIMCLIKQFPQLVKDYKWFAQDGKGGIWLCELNPELIPGKSEQLFTCHEGGIRAIGVSSFSSHIATLDVGGALHLYNYAAKILLSRKQFSAGGADLIWLPKSVDGVGCTLIMGFSDGVIRMALIDLDERKQVIANRVHLIEATKPHTHDITKLSVNPEFTYLVSGSSDNTVFIYALIKNYKSINLSPIGFVQLPSMPTALNWATNEPSALIVGCSNGQILQIDKLEKIQNSNKNNISYKLERIQFQIFQFSSIKSQIRRDIKLDEIKLRKDKKRERKIENMNKLKKENPGIEIDEEIFLADSEPETELEPLYIPKIPNKILWLHCTVDETIWLSLSGYDAGYIYECRITEPPTQTIRSTLIYDMDDIEIHSYLYIHDFLIFGMHDGSIRVNKLKKEDFRDLSDYWKLNMHDNFNGVIPQICSSYDNRYIFSIGNDGNLFSYKWNVPIDQVDKMESIPKLERSKLIASDIEDKNYLSLEQQKIKNELDNRNRITAERREKFYDILSDYRVQFKEIIKRNRDLPLLQQFTPDDLELDPRITQDFVDSLDEQLQLVRRKMAFDVQKAQLATKKLMEFFIDPLEDLPVKVTSIRNANMSVVSFRIHKLDEEFMLAKEDLQERIKREKEKRSDPRKASIRNGVIQLIEDVGTKEMKPVMEPQESFLQGLSSSTIEMKLGSKMKRLLDKYRSRKIRESERNFEWEIVNSERPDPNKNHEDDDRKIEEARKAIGDYKLKSDPEYVPDERDNTLQKYKELLRVREDIFNKRNSYNVKVFELRKKKNELYTYIENKQIQLKFIHEQIPKDKQNHIRSLPPIVETSEYPENVLKVTVQTGTGVEVRDLFYRKSEALRKSFLKAEKKQEDRYRQLALRVLNMDPDAEHLNFEQLCKEIDKFPKISEHKKDVLKELAKRDDTPSVWQLEVRFLRTADNILKQDDIILDIESRIEMFDKELQDLAEQRLSIDIEAKFLENYILTLNQELWILREFERIEDNFIENVDNTLLRRNEIQTEIIKYKSSIEAHRKIIESHNEKQKVIQEEFFNMIRGNKFDEFLNKIFRIKYKPPRITRVDESDESPDSADSWSMNEEDDNKSIDSLDISPLKMDEDYCPQSMDRSIYDTTFTLRNERHILEQKTYYELRQIEEDKKKIDEISSKIKNVEKSLNEHKRKLADFRYEKQKILNKIETLVILRMNQMQYFRDDENINNVENTLLFQTDNVTKLHSRVEQLAHETLEATRRHKVNIIHLTRMKSDCNYMEKKIQKLKDQINNAMIKKFGIIVNLDELEESVLRHFVFNIRSELQNEKNAYDAEIDKRKQVLAELEIDLLKETQISTEKLNILTVLQEEKNYLSDVLSYQKKISDKLKKTPEQINFRHDLLKLEEIERQQEEQIDFLEKEILSLRFKSKPWSPLELDHTRAVADSSRNSRMGTSNIREIILPHDERNYEESIYINVQATTPRSTSDQPNVNILDKTSSIVHNFLTKHCGTQMSISLLTKYTNKISKYLAYIVNNMDPNEEDTEGKLVKEVVTKFQSMLPKTILAKIVPEDIVRLFERIIAVRHYEENDISSIEVVSGIISNAFETINIADTNNYTHDLVHEILRDMIEVLPAEDIQNDQIIKHISSNLIILPEIVPQCINVVKMANEITRHAQTNLIDDVTLTFVKNFLETLIKSMTRTTIRVEVPSKK